MSSADSMLEPMVTVMVPVYNAAPYLEQCLSSILGQTHKRLRLVVLDDGSTDGSAAIIDSYAAADKRVTAIHRPNGGVASARNELLRHVQGDWFIFVDADDWIEPRMLSTLVSIGRDAADDIDIVMCSNVVNDTMPQLSAPVDIWPREETLRAFVEHKRMSGSLWNKLISTRLLFAPTPAPQFDPAVSYGEDALFLWQLLPHMRSMAVTPAQFYHYRMNPASLSHASYGPGKASAHIVWTRIAADTARLFPSLAPLARASLGICDMWILYYAACDRAPFTPALKAIRSSLRRNFMHMLQHRALLTPKKLLFALASIINYTFAKSLAQRSKCRGSEPIFALI